MAVAPEAFRQLLVLRHVLVGLLGVEDIEDHGPGSATRAEIGHHAIKRARPGPAHAEGLRRAREAVLVEEDGGHLAGTLPGPRERAGPEVEGRALEAVEEAGQPEGRRYEGRPCPYREAPPQVLEPGRPPSR